MSEYIWNEWFTIRSFETNDRSHASMQTICNIFQDVAGNHVRSLHIGIEDLMKQGMTWVLSRFHIKIHRCPVWKEHIRVESWPSGSIGFYALRDFSIFDEHDQQLVSASSIWLILDIKKRLPLRIPDHVIAMNVKARERALYDPFDTIWRPKEVRVEKCFTVRYSDIDLNQHVNNVKYVEWSIEAVPREIWETHQITEIEVSFREEALYGDIIISQAGQTEEDGQQLFTHRIIRESDGVELFLARTRWQPGNHNHKHVGN